MTAKTLNAILAETMAAPDQQLKTASFQIKATEGDGADADEQRIVYGWASVIEQNGKDYIDSQGDIIEEKELLRAARAFMQDPVGLAQHAGKQIGTVVESMVMTKDLQAALGIDLGMVGWLVGMYIADDEVWADVKSRVYTGFSIGYYARREAA